MTMLGNNLWRIVIAAACLFASAEAAPKEGELAGDAAVLVERLKEAEAKDGFARVKVNEAGKVTEIFVTAEFVSKENVALLRQARDVEVLRLGCARKEIGEELGQALQGMTSLKELGIYGCGAEALAKLPAGALGELRVLTIKHQPIGAKELEVIAALPKLEFLELQSVSGLSLQAMQPLVKNRKIRELGLAFSDASEGVLEVLLAMKGTLKRVDARGNRISEEGIELLRRSGFTVRR